MSQFGSSLANPVLPFTRTRQEAEPEPEFDSFLDWVKDNSGSPDEDALNKTRRYTNYVRKALLSQDLYDVSAEQELRGSAATIFRHLGGVDPEEEDYVQASYDAGLFQPDESGPSSDEQMLDLLARTSDRFRDEEELVQDLEIFDMARRTLAESPLEEGDLGYDDMVNAYTEARTKALSHTENPNTVNRARRRQLEAGVVDFIEVYEPGDNPGEVNISIEVADGVETRGNVQEAVRRSIEAGALSPEHAVDALHLLTNVPGREDMPIYKAAQNGRTLQAVQVMMHDTQRFHPVLEKLGEFMADRDAGVSSEFDYESVALGIALEMERADPAGNKYEVSQIKTALEVIGTDQAFRTNKIKLVDDDEALGNNIRVTSDGTAMAHPAVLVNGDLFEAALAQKAPYLEEAQIESLIQQRHHELVARFDHYNELLTREDGYSGNKWVQFRDTMRGQGISDADILDEFLRDKANFSEVKSRLGGVGASMADSWTELAAMPMLLFGSDWAQEHLIENNQQRSDRRELARMFGEEYGALQDLSEGIAPLVTDLAVTGLLAAVTAPIGGAGAAVYAGLKSTATLTARGLGKALVTRSLLPRVLAEGTETAKEAAIRNMAANVIKQGSSPADAIKVIDAYNKALSSKWSSVPAMYLSAANRQASGTYGAIYNQLSNDPNNDLSPEEIHDKALGTALTTGAVTGLITTAFTGIGLGGVDDLILAGASKQTIKGALAKMADVDDISDAAFKQIVKDRLKAAIKDMALDSPRSLASKIPGFVTDGIEEMIEEGTDQFVNTFVEDAMVEGDWLATPMLDRLMQTWHAAMLGGALGGGISAGRSIVRRARFDRDTIERAAVEKAERNFVDSLVNDLSNTASPLTAQVVGTVLRAGPSGRFRIGELELNRDEVLQVAMAEATEAEVARINQKLEEGATQETILAEERARNRGEDDDPITRPYTVLEPDTETLALESQEFKDTLARRKERAEKANADHATVLPSEGTIAAGTTQPLYTERPEAEYDTLRGSEADKAFDDLVLRGRGENFDLSDIPEKNLPTLTPERIRVPIKLSREMIESRDFVRRYGARGVIWKNSKGEWTQDRVISDRDPRTGEPVYTANVPQTDVLLAQLDEATGGEGVLEAEMEIEVFRDPENPDHYLTVPELEIRLGLRTEPTKIFGLDYEGLDAYFENLTPLEKELTRLRYGPRSQTRSQEAYEQRRRSYLPSWPGVGPIFIGNRNLTRARNRLENLAVRHELVGARLDREIDALAALGDKIVSRPDVGADGVLQDSASDKTKALFMEAYEKTLYVERLEALHSKMGETIKRLERIAQSQEGRHTLSWAERAHAARQHAKHQRGLRDASEIEARSEDPEYLRDAYEAWWAMTLADQEANPENTPTESRDDMNTRAGLTNWIAEQERRQALGLPATMPPGRSQFDKSVDVPFTPHPDVAGDPFLIAFMEQARRPVPAAVSATVREGDPNFIADEALVTLINLYPEGSVPLHVREALEARRSRDSRAPRLPKPRTAIRAYELLQEGGDSLDENTRRRLELLIQREGFSPESIESRVPRTLDEIREQGGISNFHQAVLMEAADEGGVEGLPDGWIQKARQVSLANGKTTTSIAPFQKGQVVTWVKEKGKRRRVTVDGQATNITLNRKGNKWFVTVAGTQFPESKDKVLGAGFSTLQHAVDTIHDKARLLSSGSEHVPRAGLTSVKPLEPSPEHIRKTTNEFFQRKERKYYSKEEGAKADNVESKPKEATKETPAPTATEAAVEAAEVVSQERQEVVDPIIEPKPIEEYLEGPEPNTRVVFKTDGSKAYGVYTDGPKKGQWATFDVKDGAAVEPTRLAGKKEKGKRRTERVPKKQPPSAVIAGWVAMASPENRARAVQLYRDAGLGEPELPQPNAAFKKLKPKTKAAKKTAKTKKAETPAIPDVAAPETTPKVTPPKVAPPPTAANTKKSAKQTLEALDANYSELVKLHGARMAALADIKERQRNIAGAKKEAERLAGVGFDVKVGVDRKARKAAIRDKFNQIKHREKAELEVAELTYAELSKQFEDLAKPLGIDTTMGDINGKFRTRRKELVNKLDDPGTAPEGPVIIEVLDLSSLDLSQTNTKQVVMGDVEYAQREGNKVQLGIVPVEDYQPHLNIASGEVVEGDVRESQAEADAREASLLDTAEFPEGSVESTPTEEQIIRAEIRDHYISLRTQVIQNRAKAEAKRLKEVLGFLPNRKAPKKRPKSAVAGTEINIFSSTKANKGILVDQGVLVGYGSEGQIYYLDRSGRARVLPRHYHITLFNEFALTKEEAASLSPEQRKKLKERRQLAAQSQDNYRDMSYAEREVLRDKIAKTRKRQEVIADVKARQDARRRLEARNKLVDEEGNWQPSVMEGPIAEIVEASHRSERSGKKKVQYPGGLHATSMFSPDLLSNTRDQVRRKQIEFSFDMEQAHRDGDDAKVAELQGQLNIIDDLLEKMSDLLIKYNNTLEVRQKLWADPHFNPAISDLVGGDPASTAWSGLDPRVFPVDEKGRAEYARSVRLVRYGYPVTPNGNGAYRWPVRHYSDPEFTRHIDDSGKSQIYQFYAQKIQEAIEWKYPLVPVPEGGDFAVVKNGILYDNANNTPFFDNDPVRMAEVISLFYEIEITHLGPDYPVNPAFRTYTTPDGRTFVNDVHAPRIDGMGTESVLDVARGAEIGSNIPSEALNYEYVDAAAGFNALFSEEQDKSMPVRKGPASAGPNRNWAFLSRDERSKILTSDEKSALEARGVDPLSDHAWKEPELRDRKLGAAAPATGQDETGITGQRPLSDTRAGSTMEGELEALNDMVVSLSGAVTQQGGLATKYNDPNADRIRRTLSDRSLTKDDEGNTLPGDADKRVSLWEMLAPVAGPDLLRLSGDVDYILDAVSRFRVMYEQHLRLFALRQKMLNGKYTRMNPKTGEPELVRKRLHGLANMILSTWDLPVDIRPFPVDELGRLSKDAEKTVTPMDALSETEEAELFPTKQKIVQAFDLDIRLDPEKPHTPSMRAIALRFADQVLLKSTPDELPSYKEVAQRAANAVRQQLYRRPGATGRESRMESLDDPNTPIATTMSAAFAEAEQRRIESSFRDDIVQDTNENTPAADHMTEGFFGPENLVSPEEFMDTPSEAAVATEQEILDAEKQAQLEEIERQAAEEGTDNALFYMVRDELAKLSVDSGARYESELTSAELTQFAVGVTNIMVRYIDGHPGDPENGIDPMPGDPFMREALRSLFVKMQGLDSEADEPGLTQRLDNMDTETLMAEFMRAANQGLANQNVDVADFMTRLNRGEFPESGYLRPFFYLFHDGLVNVDTPFENDILSPQELEAQQDMLRSVLQSTQSLTEEQIERMVSSPERMHLLYRQLKREFQRVRLMASENRALTEAEQAVALAKQKPEAEALGLQHGQTASIFTALEGIANGTAGDYPPQLRTMASAILEMRNLVHPDLVFNLFENISPPYAGAYETFTKGPPALTLHLNSDGGDGSLAHTLIHEMWHATLTNALAAEPDALSDSQNAALDTLKREFRAARAAAAQEAKRTGQDMDPLLAYGLSNIDEFVAHIASSSKFQSLLKNLPTPANQKNGFFKRILQAIADFFGLRDKFDTDKSMQAIIDLGFATKRREPLSMNNVMSTAASNAVLSIQQRVARQRVLDQLLIKKGLVDPNMLTIPDDVGIPQFDDVIFPAAFSTGEVERTLVEVSRSMGEIPLTAPIILDGSTTDVVENPPIVWADEENNIHLNPFLLPDVFQTDVPKRLHKPIFVAALEEALDDVAAIRTLSQQEIDAAISELTLEDRVSALNLTGQELDAETPEGAEALAQHIHSTVKRTYRAISQGEHSWVEGFFDNPATSKVVLQYLKTRIDRMTQRGNTVRKLSESQAKQLDRMRSAVRQLKKNFAPVDKTKGSTPETADDAVETTVAQLTGEPAETSDGDPDAEAREPVLPPEAEPVEPEGDTRTPKEILTNLSEGDTITLFPVASDEAPVTATVFAVKDEGIEVQVAGSEDLISFPTNTASGALGVSEGWSVKPMGEAEAPDVKQSPSKGRKAPTRSASGKAKTPSIHTDFGNESDIPTRHRKNAQTYEEFINLIHLPLMHTEEYAQGMSWGERMVRGEFDPRVRRLVTQRKTFERATLQMVEAYKRDIDRIIKKEFDGDASQISELMARASGTTEPTIDKDTNRKFHQDLTRKLAAAVANPSSVADYVKNYKAEGAAREARGELSWSDSKIQAHAEARALEEVRQIIRDEHEEQVQRIRYQHNKIARDARDKALDELAAKSPALRDKVVELRMMVDEMSKVARRAFGTHNPGIEAIIDGNLGIYITRAYRMFDDKNYRDAITNKNSEHRNAKIEKTLKAADFYFEKTFLSTRSEYYQKTLGLSIFEADKKANLDLEAKHDSDKRYGEHIREQFLASYEPDPRGARIVRRDNDEAFRMIADNLERRKDLPDEIRELLGEYGQEDGINHLLRTLGTVAGMASNQIMLDQIKDQGQKGDNPYILDTKAVVQMFGSTGKAQQEGWAQVKVPGADALYNPLRNMWAPAELATAIQSAGSPEARNLAESTADGFIRTAVNGFRKVTGWSMAMKTLGSIGHFTRNVSSQPFMMLYQGNPHLLPHTLMSLVKEGGHNLLPRGWQKWRNDGETLDKERLRLVQLGVIGGGVKVETLKQLMRGDTSPEAVQDAVIDKIKKASNGGTKAAKEFGGWLSRAEETTETFYKIAYFYDTVKTLEKARANGKGQIRNVPIAEMSDLDIAREAAEQVQQTTPTFDRTMPWVTSITKSGVGALVSPFLRWKSEMLRAPIGTGMLAFQEIQSGNPVLVARGARRILGMSLVAAMSTVVPKLLSDALGGVGEEEDEALRAAIQPYLRDHSFTYYRSENGELTSLDLTYLNMFSQWGDPIMRSLDTLRRTNNVGAAAWKLIKVGFVDVFLDEQIFSSTILNASRNYDPSTEQPIFLEGVDTPRQIVTKQMRFIWDEAFAPRVASDAEKAIAAAQGDFELTRQTPWSIFMKGVYPVKPYPVDPERSLRRVLFENQDKINMIGSERYEAMIDKPMSEEEVRDVYRNEVERTRRVYENMYRLIQGYKGLGLSEQQIYDHMVDSRIGKEKSDLILREKMMPAPQFPSKFENQMNQREYGPSRMAILKDEQARTPRYLGLE